VFSQGYIFGKPAVASVTNALPNSAAVLTSGITSVTTPTGFGKYADHTISGVQARYFITGFFYDSRNLVAQNHVWRHSAPEHTRHD
jgi:hypothetical protein